MMVVKKGKLRVDYTDTVYSLCDVAEFILNDMVIVFVNQYDGVVRGGFYRFNVDLNDTAAVSAMFSSPDYSNPTVSWVTPMTEVPSQGGGSGLTIEDVYPVGIEITTTDTTFNPMKVWGGTWTVSPAGAKRVWTRTA